MRTRAPVRVGGDPGGPPGRLIPGRGRAGWTPDAAKVTFPFPGLVQALPEYVHPPSDRKRKHVPR